ncbi:hypothetical protein STBA_57100 [Streptomyces sp. MP131-18]|nr:hypothetical protein STBA_57100 [Streptomyces sp. MP131-18]
MLAARAVASCSGATARMARESIVITGAPVGSVMARDAVPGAIQVRRTRMDTAAVVCRDTPLQENGTRMESCAASCAVTKAPG